MIGAVDIGGTCLKSGLISNGQIIQEMKLDSRPKAPFHETMFSVRNCFEQMLSKLGEGKKELFGIGIGFPGIVDSKKHKVLNVNEKFGGALFFDFQKWAYENFNCPVALENDARTALLGEWQFGVGSGYDNICMITLGTGVGSAVLMEGKLMKGIHFQAGNLGGHFTININGGKCSCGNYGCVEGEASTWVLEKIIKSDVRYSKSSLNGKALDFESLFTLASQGDKLAKDIKNQCLEAWAACVINMVNAYDPELVILDGGIMGSADEIIPFVRKRVNERAWTPCEYLSIVSSKIPNQSALLGAAFALKSTLHEK